MAELKSGSSLTFSSEGNNVKGSPFYSRVAHVPPDPSGVTIGRGYDMKMRSAAQIIAELKEAGIDEATAKLLSNAASLSGKKAREFVAKPEIAAIEITEEQQINLFNITYMKSRKDAARLCQKDDVQKIYGNCGWDKIDAGIKEFVTDLTFRGDYSGKERVKIQEAIIKNDYDTLIKLAKDKSVWKGNLDNSRFNARIQHLERAAFAFKKK